MAKFAASFFLRNTIFFSVRFLRISYLGVKILALSFYGPDPFRKNVGTRGRHARRPAVKTALRKAVKS